MKELSVRPYETAYNYTVRYYPRWFTWVQSRLNTENSPTGQSIINRLAGPLGMGPEYKIVVAINDDTVYTQAFLEISGGPMILTIPPYPNHYSVLQLDVFGAVISTSLTQSPPQDGGSFGFCLAGQESSLPAGVTPVVLPYGSTELILRIDKYSQGQNVITEANSFRASLLLRTVEQFEAGTTGLHGGGTFIAPLFNYAPSVKMMADVGVLEAPEAFLETLREAMDSPTTQPITEADATLIGEFNALFDDARRDPDSPLMSHIIQGARAAHAALVNRWQSRRGATNWVHFDNIGHWGDAYLDRAALTEYIQYGNDLAAAFYANAFVDGSGVPLDGASFAYTLTFTPETLPQYQRFWSLTAYTPGPIELVPNSLNKYVVASYTPGLVTDESGNITVIIQADEPSDGQTANWLPVPKGPFSLLFRVYGPEGAARDGSYLTPKLHRVTPR